MSGLGSEIYTGVAEYGKIRTIIGTVIGTLLGIGLIIGGLVLIKRKSKLTELVTATITNEPICVQYQDKNLTKWKCSNIQLGYKVGDKDYTSTVESDGNIKYTKGLSISVYYDPASPGTASMVSDNVRPIGWILLVIGLIALVGAWFWLFIVMRYKVAAAAAGAEGVIGTIRGGFGENRY